MLGHKTSLKAFKETEIISSIVSDHSGMKLKISNKKKTDKFTHMETEQSTPEQVKEEIKRKTKKICRDN